MIKQAIALIGLSIAVVLFMSYAQQAVDLILHGHDWVSQVLTNVFSGGQAGNILRGLIALISIPLVVALIPTVIYWMTKRSWFPYFMEVMWVVWLLQAGALIVLYKAVTA